MYASKWGWISILVVGSVSTGLCIAYEAWYQLAFFWAMILLGLYAGKRAKKPEDDNDVSV